jgi:GDP-L-fucose synthase
LNFLKHSLFIVKKAILFGSETMLGSALQKHLEKRDVEVFPIEKQNLIDCDAIIRAMEAFSADIAFNASLRNYGIHKHIESPADLFEDVQFIEGRFLPAAYKAGVKKYVNLIPNCVYPAEGSIPFHEDSLWNGPPDASVQAYAQGKRNLIVQAQAFRKQYGFNAINLILTAFYGPHDSFDPKNAQVIPSMIVKMHQAMKEDASALVLWGSGFATREFIFIDDVVELVYTAAFKYNSGESLNISTGKEVSIKQLAGMLKELMGYKGEICWDSSKPEGIKRKCLSPQRFQDQLGDFSVGTLDEGLKKTVGWYCANS